MDRGASQGTVHGVTLSDMTNTYIQTGFISKTFCPANLMCNISMKDRTGGSNKARKFDEENDLS